jgi:hypothetical protein
VSEPQYGCDKFPENAIKWRKSNQLSAQTYTENSKPCLTGLVDHGIPLSVAGIYADAQCVEPCEQPFALRCFRDAHNIVGTVKTDILFKIE